MFNNFRGIYIFNKAVETGSFRATARALNLSPSVVSYHISRLEKNYSVALFYRSTRRLTLTKEGKRIFDKVQPLINSVENEFDTLTSSVEQPEGKLNITILTGFSRGAISQQIANFSNHFPSVKLSINYSDQHEDIIASGTDLAIRGGAMKDSGLMSRKMFTLERKLVASPKFLKNSKTLKNPLDLTSVNWIWHENTPTFRVFKHKKLKQSHKIKMNSIMAVNNGDALCNMALEGLGLITVPTYLMNEFLNSGKLLEVLPDWKLDPFEVHAVWPANSPQPSIASRFVEYLSKANIN